MSFILKAEVKNALKKIESVIPSLIDKLSIDGELCCPSSALQWCTGPTLCPFPLLKDVVVHEFATLCLALLSVDYICKVKIFESNGLPPLIQLLTSPDPDVKKNSLEIIFNTAQVTCGELLTTATETKDAYEPVERAVVCVPCTN